MRSEKRIHVIISARDFISSTPANLQEKCQQIHGLSLILVLCSI
jgi:hypothetical protein